MVKGQLRWNYNTWNHLTLYKEIKSYQIELLKINSNTWNPNEL